MVMNIIKGLERLFPNLKSTDCKITSPYNPTYNCIAWAAGNTSAWWEPDPMGTCYWPPGIPREYSISAYRAVYESLGYNQVSNENFDPTSHKVAVFAKAGIPTHASRQVDTGDWTSKIGRNVDIEHTLQGLVGNTYGIIDVILKKPR